MIDFDFSADLEKVVHATLKEAGIFGRDKARNTTLFKNDGALRAATNFFETSKSTGFVIADKSYAVFLEEGNDQHGPFIYPTKSKALHFFINGEEIFTKKVRSHPGYYFMEKAAEDVHNELSNIWERNFDKYVR